MGKTKTAEELIQELNKNPDFLKKRNARDEHIKKLEEIYSNDEIQLVSELNSELKTIGCHVNSVWDLVNSVSTYQVVCPILQNHLYLSHHERIREGIIRALTVKDVGREIEGALFECFKNEQNKELNWVLSNALKTVMPYHRRRKHPEIKEVFENKDNTEASG